MNLIKPLLVTGRETVLIRHGEQYISPDGNIMYRPSDTDVEEVSNCAVQLKSQSGTSARRAEQNDEGFNLEQLYRLRPSVTYPRIIHWASVVEWRDKVFHIMGYEQIYNGSNNTAHIDYTMRSV